MKKFSQFVSEGITPAKAAELFMFGGCLCFAIELQKKIGGGIFVIYDREGQAYHAFVRTDGGDYDVKGKRASIISMVRDFSSKWAEGGWEAKGPVDPAHVPFKNTPSLRAKAEQYIKDNPKLFGV